MLLALILQFILKLFSFLGYISLDKNDVFSFLRPIYRQISYLSTLIYLSAIILLKPNSDFLSGLSKLDYLYMVSDFQRYKD